MEPYADVVESSRQFAREASDSPCFVAWSEGVADDPRARQLIATLPPVKQQPNLVFAAARWHGAPAPGPYTGLREVLLSQWESVRGTILVRSTQTNEVGRLATLLPAFVSAAGETQPLALLEVGASAGLNLYPERFRYLWRRTGGSTYSLGEGLELTCEVNGEPSLPDRLPTVTWRGGVDLHPLDVTDEDAMAWLTNLVWPEQDERRERLGHAIEIAASEPPTLVQGDLIEALPGLLDEVAEAVPEAIPVVFHSAVIAYLEPPRRREFHELMTSLTADGRCHWVSNEAANVLPEVAVTGPRTDLIGFTLGVDGQAVGIAHGHGRQLHWFG